jgi:Flp pilus assembly protein TadD
MKNKYTQLNLVSMKLLFITAFLLVLGLAARSQQKNPTNTKEIQDKIKQAQQQLNKLSPEQKKLMEQMGISTSVPAMPNGISDADVKAAFNGDAFSVPSKNATLIAAIPKITLTAASLPSYVKALNEYVEKGISAEAKQAAQLIYTDYKKNKFLPEAIGNASVGIWISGQMETAVCLIGKASTDNPTDPDLLSNFAAMLSMGGAPHKAIPVLEYLSKQFPDNTTILNNLGQAWFYLGETDKANTQLNKAVKAFAYHPQANYTQCLIEQSKGNTTAAIEKMKNSLAYSFSANKLNMLRKLGYKVKAGDMRKPFQPDPNPLGLNNFERPDVPKTYDDELRLKADWDAFQKQIGDKSMQLAQSLIPYQNANNQKAMQLYNQYQKNGIAGLSGANELPDNMYRRMAEINLEQMDKDGGEGFRLKTALKQVQDIKNDFATKNEAQRKSIEKQYSIKATQESELAKKGENIGFDNCVVQEKYSEWVYNNYNKPLESAYQQYLHQLKIKISEELYWKQFTQDKETFKATIIAKQKEWLSALGATRYIATDVYGKCVPVKNNRSNFKLADFDDLNCKYHSKLDFGFDNSIETHCEKMTVNFGAGPLSGHLNYKSDNKGQNRFVNGSAEATVFEKSVGVGPVQAGVKAGVGVEFTNKGIEDVYATGEASVVNVTAAGKISLISGNMSGGISGFGK